MSNVISWRHKHSIFPPIQPNVKKANISIKNIALVTVICKGYSDWCVHVCTSYVLHSCRCLFSVTQFQSLFCVCVSVCCVYVRVSFFHSIDNFSHNCGFVTSAKLCHNTTHNRDRNIKHPFMLMDSIINHEKWNTINFLRLHKHCFERGLWCIDFVPPNNGNKAFPDESEIAVNICLHNGTELY